MKFLLGLFLAFSALVSAQNQRFMYEYKFVPDINVKDTVKTEMMYLDITPTGSHYYSRQKFISDSIMTAQIKEQMRTTPGSFSVKSTGKQGLVKEEVIKTYPSFEMILKTSIGNYRYKVLDTSKMQWNILPEKEKVGEYMAQKATTSFGGREWTAWFSSDLPFQDGPYKFHGLPGLIVKLEDASKTHRITLEGNTTFATDKATDESLNIPGQSIVIGGLNGKELNVTAAQFKKSYKEYANDPAKEMRQMLASAGPTNKVTIRFQDNSGKMSSSNEEALRFMEQDAKERIKKDNNKIEPNLYE